MNTYLCGGINGLSDKDCRDWRQVAKTLLQTETLDPMRRDYRGKEHEAVDEIVRGDLADIGNSAFVLVNATRPSWGTAMEIVYASKQGCRIVAFTGDARISPWLRFHCDAIVASPEEAVAWIHAEIASPGERQVTQLVLNQSQRDLLYELLIDERDNAEDNARECGHDPDGYPFQARLRLVDEVTAQLDSQPCRN